MILVIFWLALEKKGHENEQHKQYFLVAFFKMQHEMGHENFLTSDQASPYYFLIFMLHILDIVKKSAYRKLRVIIKKFYIGNFFIKTSKCNQKMSFPWSFSCPLLLTYVNFPGHRHAAFLAYPTRATR